VSHRRTPISRLAVILGALVLVVAACTGGAASTTSPAGGATPAAATPAGATPAVELPSGIQLPSFNADTDLESQLPDTFCGQPTQKLSFSGEDAVGDDADFASIVAALGRSPADASIAFAGVAGPECAGINLIAFRIKGADGGRFEQAFLDSQAQDSGTRPVKKNVGGKDVWVFTDSSDTTSYVYFRGDTIFGVSAESEADAAKGLAVMP
jgi:hypothetical protein